MLVRALSWLCFSCDDYFFHMHCVPLCPPFVSLSRSLFFKQEMELALIGLQNAGKTSLVNVIAVRHRRQKRITD